MKRRQTGPRDGEERQSPAEEQKKELSITAGSAGLQLSWLSLLCLSVPLLFSWLYLQQDARLADMTQKYESLVERSRGAEQLEEKLKELSLQCASVSDLCAASSVSQMEALDVQVSQLKQQFSSLSEHSQQLQQNLSMLTHTLQDMDKDNSGVSSEVLSKVSSIRTDVRRMSGLQTEVEELLDQTTALEEKLSQAEKLMVKRIGELLAGSIDRVSSLRSSAERNGQSLEQLHTLAQEISSAQRTLADRMLALESGQAKLLKVATFTADLKPTVFTVRQELAIMEPRLDDLTLRIGQLAEDMLSIKEERLENREDEHLEENRDEELLNREDNHLEEPREEERLEEPRDKQHLEEPRDKQHLEEPREKERLEEPRDEERLEEPRDKQRLEEPRDEERLEEPRDKQHLEEPREKERLEEPRDEERLEEPRDKQRLEEPRDKQHLEEPRDEERLEEPRDEERLEEPRDEERLEEPRNEEHLENYNTLQMEESTLMTH